VTFPLALLLLIAGFAFGRLYQWLRFELPPSASASYDPMATAQRTMTDIATRTRRAEEQIRRTTQHWGRSSR